MSIERVETGPSPSYNTLPYTQPVGNQVIGEQKTAQSASTRQAQQSVQLTDYTWIEQTTGVGVGAFTVMFDVAFTAEPVVAHGMTLPDFAAEVRADVDSASAAAAEAEADANSYQWTFPGNITIGAFQGYDDGQQHNEVVPYKFAITGISNSMNDGKKITLVAKGKTYTTSANLSPAAPSGVLLVGAGDRPNALAGYGTIGLDHLNLDTYTWQLLADGAPLTATGGFDTTDTHDIETLSQAAIDARKAAAAAGTTVGDVLALGGDTSAFPLCNVYVKRWLLNTQNNYIGAECIVVCKTFNNTTTETPIIIPSEPEIIT